MGSNLLDSRLCACMLTVLSVREISLRSNKIRNYKNKGKNTSRFIGSNLFDSRLGLRMLRRVCIWVRMEFIQVLNTTICTGSSIVLYNLQPSSIATFICTIYSHLIVCSMYIYLQRARCYVMYICVYHGSR
jgi:hypothetical protein